MPPVDVTTTSHGHREQGMAEQHARVDLGRVVAVTIFALMLALNAVKLTRDARWEPLATAVTVLTMAFYVLLVWAYLRRSPSDRTDRRWTSWLAAFAGSAAPFAIPLVSGGLVEDQARETASVLVLGVGLVAMLWSLGALGTNISVVPQAREVITYGPYSLVRHPLYTAELVSITGLCLAHRGPWPWVVLAALLAFQVIRARREEALLTRELPGYADYRARTPMLVPALRRHQ